MQVATALIELLDGGKMYSVFKVHNVPDSASNFNIRYISSTPNSVLTTIYALEQASPRQDGRIKNHTSANTFHVINVGKVKNSPNDQNYTLECWSSFPYQLGFEICLP